jgi:hypothetical protein
MYLNVAYRKSLNPDIFWVAMTEPRVALLVRVPVSLKSRLDEIAKQERRSLSKQVELLLEECLEFRDRERTRPPAKERRRRKD